MYLSKLIINSRSRQVQREIAVPYQMHRTIMRAFPKDLPADERVLFRLETAPRTGTLMVLVQSQHKPNWSYLTDGRVQPYLLPLHQLPVHVGRNPDTKLVYLQFRAGQSLVFRLQANPTKRLGKSAGENQGKRVGIYKEEDQLKWLRRKAENGGFRVHSARVKNRGFIQGKGPEGCEKKRHQLSLSVVQFDGALQVTDPDLFLETVHRGVGSGKGFGCGLLSVAPPPS